VSDCDPINFLAAFDDDDLGLLRLASLLPRQATGRHEDGCMKPARETTGLGVHPQMDTWGDFVK
jgi:hypothetical protein